MSGQDINVYTNEVTNLKHKFISQCKTDEKAAIETLKHMRSIHGCAIYETSMDKDYIIEKNIDNVSENELIKLSINASLLHVIHSHIRCCERMLYKHKRANTTTESGSIIESPPESPPESPQDSPKESKKYGVGNIIAKIRETLSGVDEISLKNVGTETSEVPETVVSRISKIPVIIPTDTDNISDYIRNLTTSEAEHLASQYGETEEKTINKPTIINYWADWCGFSKKFMPSWNEFKEHAHSQFPNLQVVDLNVGRNEKYRDVAENAGVKGYPTIILYRNGEKYNKVASGMKADDISNFIKYHWR